MKLRIEAAVDTPTRAHARTCWFAPAGRTAWRTEGRVALVRKYSAVQVTSSHVGGIEDGVLV